MARHLYDRLTHIATPRDGMAGCSTREKYVARHLHEIAAKRAAFPSLDFKVFDAPTGAVPLVTGGKWVVICECGDAPMASPEWDEARCFACGAVYRSLAWPPDRKAIEHELVARPSALVRAWLPNESVDDLRQQNADHGIVVKERA